MKKRMIEKVLSLTLVLSMLMSMMSITAFADNTGSGAIIGADGGYFAEIDFRLFDYSGDSNTNDQVDAGVNSNGVADFFKFRGSHKENSAESSALLPQKETAARDRGTAACPLAGGILPFHPCLLHLLCRSNSRRIYSR